MQVFALITCINAEPFCFNANDNHSPLVSVYVFALSHLVWLAGVNKWFTTCYYYVIIKLVLLAKETFNFHASVKNNSDLLRFCIATLRHWLKNITPFCCPIRGNTEANRDPLGDVSRASCRLPVCASRFDWLNGL